MKKERICMYKNKLLTIILSVIVCIIISQPSFAKSNLKNKISNIFQKIEKQIDKETVNTASETDSIRAQITSAPEIIVASTTKKLKLKDFNFNSQEQVKIKPVLIYEYIGKFDNNGVKYEWCQGFTADDEYFYVALLSKGPEINKHTLILKIRISDFKIIKYKDLGKIGHSNSLTYNPKTKKIYSAPIWKNWKCIFEFDTDLDNLREVYLYKENGDIIKDKQYWSVTYLPSLDQYMVKYSGTYLGYFDSDFKLVKNLRLLDSLNLEKGNSSQALSTDEENLYSVTNKKLSNYILIYDMEGHYVDNYLFVEEFGRKVELEQITFVNGKCYGLACFGRCFGIFEINLKSLK